MRKVTLADRLRYRFDNTISRGTVALIGWLFLVLVALVLTSTLFVYLTGLAPASGGERPGFFQTLWIDLMRTIDPGNVGGDQGSWPYLLSMLAVTAGGILVFSTLIGVIFAGIDEKLADLRKGRSFVVERGHTVIYGFSPEVFSVVAEIVKANEARSIIVLPPEGPEADSKVIKTILALTNNPNRREESYHIVSRINDPENLGVAHMVGREELRLVAVDDLIARITAQTCRLSGLSVVYTDLLDFGGDEIYFTSEPRLAGITFGEALTAYERCSVIGIRKKDGHIEVNPQADTEISPDDEIVLIAEDDSTIALSEHQVPEFDASALRKPPSREPRPERTLILGWNDRAPTIVAELDNYVHSGSEVTVVTPDGAVPPSRFRS